jgi:hypothetical protein
MKYIWKWRILVFSFLALLSACGAEETPPPPAPVAIRVTISPNAANMFVDQSLQFVAMVYNSTNRAVSWTLSGVGCSGATCGTISSTGLYTAPATAPIPASVIVTATSVADSTISASATITVLGPEVIEWTWVSGSNIRDPLGIYGTKDIAAPTNVPRARQGAVSWLDSGGSLWLFGGLGVDSAGHHGWLNDLWKYDPTSLEWTWESGSNVFMQPGIYGTRNVPGPSNVPGSRVSAVSWRESRGKFWLFGGLGYDSAVGGGTLNDLWDFNPATLQWTWISGSSSNGQAGTYGTKGIPSASNVPGAREEGATWLDFQGDLWLFGGDGYDSIPWIGQLNDLWKFDTTSHEWTWASGSSTLLQAGAGIYGTKGIADPLNRPGGRYGAVSWFDSQGRFWLFGGGGVDATAEGGYLNDLWHFTR